MYPVLAPAKFATALLETQDLDPVYVALHGARRHLTRQLADRLLLAYFCTYHLGASAFLAERSDGSSEAFYKLLLTVAENAGTLPTAAMPPAQRLLLGEGGKPWPRGTERRHWRGEQAVRSATDLVRSMQAGFGPSGLLDRWAQGRTFAGVTARVREHRGFGPWIAFKVADVLDRVRGNRVDFTDCELGFYDEPRKGAAYMRGEPTRQLSDEVFRKEVARWTKKLSAHKAPPRFERAVNVQEVETVFCKYKSHCHGHYPVGKDVREVHHGLEGWGDLAEELQKPVSKLIQQHEGRFQ